MPPDGANYARAFRGGDKLRARLAKIAEGLADMPEVRVGFLEGSTEADGTSIPMIAAVNEFGGRIEREPGTVTLYRQTNKAGTGFNKGGRFVKADKANFASDHDVGAYVINIPPRPFFRNMIAKHKGEWGDDIATILPQTGYSATRALLLMGERIKGQLQQSINDTNSPPNAPSTVAKKGFDKPLIDTGSMWNSVDYEVSNGTPE